MHGIARDLAAAGLGTLKDPVDQAGAGQLPVPGHGEARLRRRTPSLCPGFALRLVRGVKNGPSPQWLQERLKAIGLRPIYALVDVTNFISFDRGRPLHVFDAAKVKGNLCVRRARAGESLLALDGKTYALDDDMCVIADDNGVECSPASWAARRPAARDATTDVLIESALFDPINIAQTGRKLGIISDARYRFERGVDPAFVLPGLELATRMILELCGGEPSRDRHRRRCSTSSTTSIDFPLDEVEASRRPRSAVRGNPPRPRRASASTSPAAARSSRWRCRAGGPTCTARPISSRRSCASSASIASR